MDGGEAMAGRLARIVSQSLNFDYATIGDDTQMLRHVGSLLRQAASALIPIMLGAVLVALSAPLLLGGILFSTKSLKVDFKKLDPISGLKRLFSAQSLAELFKAILKSVMVGIISTLFLIHNWPTILHLVSEAPTAAMGDALELAVMCGFLIIMGLIPMVAFDVFWQVWSHIKKLRMSKQEIRDEHKQSEGDPHVKGRIRQQQRAIAQRRMMADVPKADVIVTNPTHYAVALRYDEKK